MAANRLRDMLKDMPATLNNFSVLANAIDEPLYLIRLDHGETVVSLQEPYQLLDGKVRDAVVLGDGYGHFPEFVCVPERRIVYYVPMKEA